jgi:hypothetical protein
MLISADHKPFLSDKFDVNSYANAVLTGREYDPNAPIASESAGPSTAPALRNGKGKEVAEKGDVGLELAKLNYGIVSDFLLHCCHWRDAYICANISY